MEIQRVFYIHMVDLFLFYFSVFSFPLQLILVSKIRSHGCKHGKNYYDLDPGLAILPPKTTLGCNLTCCVFESTRCHGRFAKFRCVKYTYAFKENDFVHHPMIFGTPHHPMIFVGWPSLSLSFFSLAIFLWGIGWATSWFHFWNEIKREQNMTNELVLGQIHYSN